MIKLASLPAYSSLEIEFVLKQTRQYIYTPYARSCFENLSFYTDPQVIQTLLDEVEEARDIWTFDDPVPIQSLEDIRSLLESIDPEDSFLEVGDFLALVKHLETFKNVKRFFLKRKSKYPALFKYAVGITEFDDLLHSIKKVMNQTGEIYDNASPKLKEIRQQIRILENQIKNILNRLLKKYSEYTQDDIITLRDGRHVLAIQDIHYHKVPGIVHGMSASGKTYFIEPMEVLQISNQLQELHLQERKEVIEILRALTGLVREQKEQLIYSMENLGTIDFIQAKARYAMSIKANKPVITEKKYFSIQNARHPILIDKMGFEKVVPLNCFIGDYFRILLITGPNAGGKTVALKTIGMVLVLTQIGFLPPVDEGTEISVVPGVFVDIGDKQSIEQDLSTFSSHIDNMRKIVSSAQEGSFILLDELGTATDPEQGAALSMALLDYFLEKNMFVVATTHLGQLKAYAAEKEGIENASMEFDIENLEPRFLLRIGVPGASYAFEIARRFGLPDDFIIRAKEYLGEEQISLERLLVQLNEKIQFYQEKLKDISIREAEVKGLQKILEKRATDIKEEKRKIRREALEEMEEYIRKKRTELENTIKELKKQKANAEAVRVARQQMETISREVSEIKKHEEPEEKVIQVVIGQLVKLKGIQRIGEVVTEPNEKGRLWVDFDGLKMQVQLSQLELPSEAEKIKITSQKKATGKLSPSLRKVGPELDIRGMDVQEALDVTNEYLTNAINSGWEEVRIIHGKGKGILRREINQFLARDKRVVEKRFGNWGEGDTGVTVVKLRKE
jgi:DNA mismatch repair protein MutS2